jgi:hypothetical protein
VDVEISPEPTPPEREAIVSALEELLEPEAGDPSALYRSAWRLAGLRENVDDTSAR